VLSVALLLDHVGLPKAAARVEEAVAEDLAARGSAVRSTAAVGDAIVGRLD
jgi:3-isopropylmalate dehydrogenase